MERPRIQAGHLSQYFEVVAAKRLSAVEISPGKSHQHEFHGSQELRIVLGTGTGEKVEFSTTFIWFGDDSDPVSAEAVVSWYDSRRNNPNRSEYRLYFPTNDVTDKARPGDLLLLSRRSDGSVTIIIAAGNSSMESQLLWLFRMPVQGEAGFTFQELAEKNDREINLPVRYILDTLGIILQEPDPGELDAILKKFKGKLPSTKEFSAYTRKTLTGPDPLLDPDGSLVAWMTYEEKLFRMFERWEVEQRLRQGFISDKGADVDGFIAFSLSVNNRRKARAGLALENHLEAMLELHGIRYSRKALTENKSEPDFLFPGIREYNLTGFNPVLLSMLGVKTTCKDRWRQVLSEADRIGTKHLLTLEPGISVNQTTEMQSKGLQLVIPAAFHETYDPNQRNWLLSLQDFIHLMADRQEAAQRI